MKPSLVSHEAEAPIVIARGTIAARGPERVVYTAAALAGIWTGVAFASIFGPDMVTGSLHEHMPLIAMWAWIWGGFASGLVLMASSKSRGAVRSQWQLFGGGTAGVWVVAALVMVYAPVMVTGTDPTRLPIAAITVPIIAMVLTAFLSVSQAGAAPPTA